MSYPTVPDFKKLTEQISLYTQLQHELGAKHLEPALKKAEKALAAALRQIQQTPIDKKMAQQEPNALKAIQALRPKGPRKMWDTFDAREYQPRLAGAFLGRSAGCTLGSIVEFWSLPDMEAWAKELGQPFPPKDYWAEIPNRHQLRYQTCRRDGYTRDKMNGIPVDDDLTYTQLGLLIAEDHGVNFTTADVGNAWVKYLPHACTAEDIALKNLKKNIPARKVGEIDNPYCEWIGADIRADPFGYMAPGFPQKAAEMAYFDAYISHRRQGIYGEMFFAAAVAAAFAVDDPIDAIKIGLTEIPKDCATAEAVRWALKVAPRIKNYKQAREAVDKKFAGMHGVHTINNACLTVWGLTIGGKDFTKVIGETVAMGLDNDCTAATAGSICGAVIGKSGIPPHWYKRFNNISHSYLIGHPKFAIDDLLRRFQKQAERVYAQA
jgi:ADP-ribosylglycohydrolase